MCREATDLCWIDFRDSPVPGLYWGLLHPRLDQDSLILALIIQPLVAVKHVADVCWQVQHIDSPAVQCIHV